MTAALDVRHLAVRFGRAEFAGLRGLTFDVAGGHCLAVLGASGSGKSSLRRTLAGLQAAAGGAVHVNGRDVTTLPPEKRSIVYLHQEPVLFPHRTVEENVAFPQLVRGMSAPDAKRRAVEWLARLQVDALRTRSADALSGGQRHRVALARALCAEPDVLLLDEPMASLDPATRRDVRLALQSVRAVSGVAMVLVTHDLDDALTIATRILTLGTDGPTALATPEALLRDPPSLDVARLLGIYSEIAGVVRQEENSRVFHWMGGVLPAGEAALGATIACARAHDVELVSGDESNVPELTVTDRRDGAQESVVTVRNAEGASAVVRIGSGVDTAAGDRVRLLLRRATLHSIR
jgi:ABC-type sulfate/molybdate transport systems ATPase subunit